MRALSVAADKQMAGAVAALLRGDIRALRGPCRARTIRLTALIGPPPLALLLKVRKADCMMQGPLLFIELVKTNGSGDTTVRPLAGMTVQFAAGVYKVVCA
jgi:hypothetical protein